MYHVNALHNLDEISLYLSRQFLLQMAIPWNLNDFYKRWYINHLASVLNSVTRDLAPYYLESDQDYPIFDHFTNFTFYRTSAKQLQ